MSSDRKFEGGLQLLVTLKVDGKLHLRSYPDDREIRDLWQREGELWTRRWTGAKRTATAALQVLPKSSAWQWSLSMLHKWCEQEGEPIIIRAKNDGKALRLFDIANLHKRYKVGVKEEVVGKQPGNREGQKITKSEDERARLRPLLRKGIRNYIAKNVLVQFYLSFELAAKLRAECERTGEKRTAVLRRLLDTLPEVEGGAQ